MHMHACILYCQRSNPEPVALTHTDNSTQLSPWMLKKTVSVTAQPCTALCCTLARGAAGSLSWARCRAWRTLWCTLVTYTPCSLLLWFTLHQVDNGDEYEDATDSDDEDMPDLDDGGTVPCCGRVECSPGLFLSLCRIHPVPTQLRDTGAFPSIASYGALNTSWSRCLFGTA